MCDSPATAGAGVECEDLTGSGGDWEAEACSGAGEAPTGFCQPEYQPPWMPQMQTNKVMKRHPRPKALSAQKTLAIAIVDLVMNVSILPQKRDSTYI